MERAMTTPVGVRLAVLDKWYTKALIFETTAKPLTALQQQLQLLTLRPGAPPPPPPVVALELPLAGTLLVSALATRKARFVRDCAGYMQNSTAPAGDVFTQPGRLVSSLVVVPLVNGDDMPLAAIYLTLEAPNDFSEVQKPLLVGPCCGAAPRRASLGCFRARRASLGFSGARGALDQRV
jgi:hypothetical protein